MADEGSEGKLSVSQLAANPDIDCGRNIDSFVRLNSSSCITELSSHRHEPAN